MQYYNLFQPCLQNRLEMHTWYTTLDLHSAGDFPFTTGRPTRMTAHVHTATTLSLDTRTLLTILQAELSGTSDSRYDVWERFMQCAYPVASAETDENRIQSMV
jgi:hypothetical protein